MTDDEFAVRLPAESSDTRVVYFATRCGTAVIGTSGTGEAIELTEFDATGTPRSILDRELSDSFLLMFPTPSAVVATNGFGSVVWVIDRDSGVAATIDSSSIWCGMPRVRGDFVMWQALPDGLSPSDQFDLLRCQTFVGRLP